MRNSSPSHAVHTGEQWEVDTKTGSDPVCAWASRSLIDSFALEGSYEQGEAFLHRLCQGNVKACWTQSKSVAARLVEFEASSASLGGREGRTR